MQNPTRAPLLQPSEPDDAPIGIVALLQVLWRNKFRIALPAVVLSALAAFMVLRADDIYVSEAQLLLSRGNLEIIEFDSAGGFDVAPGAIANAMTILSSRSLAMQVVDRLDLTNDPAVNPALAPAEPGEAPLGYSEVELRQLALDWLDNASQVNILPGTNVILIRATTTDPDRSAAVANAYVEAYLEYQLSLAQNETERAAAALENRVRDLRRQLESDQEALQSYLGSAQSVSPETAAALAIEATSLRRRLAETDTAIETAETALAALEDRDDAALREVIGKSEALARLVRNTLVAPLEDTDVAAAAPALREAFETELDRLEQLREALREGRVSIEARLADATDFTVRLRQLEVEVETTSQVYEALLARFKELSIQTGLRDAGAQVLARAEPPLHTAAQGRRRTVAIAGVLGLFLGMAYALLRDAANDRVRRPADIGDLAGADPVVQLPPVPRRLPLVRRKLLGEGSPFFEGVRMVRQQLQTATRPAGGPVLAGVFSGLPNEGKTTLTGSLAHSFTLIGRRVIVIDGDMRTCALSLALGMKRDAPGLQDVLGRELDPVDAITRPKKVGFDLLPGGRATGNPADLLEQPRFAELISELCQRYDVVLFDTPPILIVPDAHKIAGLLDRHVLVAGYNRSPRAAVRNALSSLRDAGAEQPVVALVGMPGALGRQYGYSRSSYRRYYG